jgi:tripartite-type tricarboxylate transporter receptor subunit TctC
MGRLNARRFPNFSLKIFRASTSGSSPGFKMMAGVNVVHVPYRGQAAALTDLLGGQVLVDFATMPPSIGFPSRSTEKS